MLEAAGTRMSSGYGATCLTAAETGFASRNVLRVQARAVRAPDGGGGGAPEEDWHSIYTEDRLL